MRTDEEIMEAVRDGDADAFESLVDRHRKTAWGVAYRLLGNSADAQEMAQEAFLKIFEARERYEPTATFKTYLYRVVTRLCYDRMEKKSPVHVDPTERAPDRDTESGPEERMLETEKKKTIRRALNELPDRQKIAITLQQYEQLRYHEIAEAMDTTKKAVERLIARARDTLKEQLADQFEGEHDPAFSPVRQEDDLNGL